ncbi:granulocyte-macrophage colony-stimulating factor receptor subunit alpha-like isoform X2 [Anarrhichthys ocellatus]|uniref:granulocyte-macrophage colony-stimulating factor receptor subunit alpha-like isoform X2 n=1 Tax=Anarrhichthys ocellatus TaxID=433405 RepID=UPI0012ECD2B3|nr:granulocyte-macrophage colony-stimulating factor receptor subunit alpha-like isoform X2 [Anarrhichthys ocellatus]
MKLLPVHPIFWSCLLILWASESESESNTLDVCQNERDPGNIHLHSPLGQEHCFKEAKVDDNFCCLYYPTDVLNCLWSFHSLEKDAQLFIQISICDEDTTVHYLSSEERVGSTSLTLHEHEWSYVILLFNITLHGNWTVYTSGYETDMLEVQSPPQNISASVRDGGLLVTWGLPKSRGKSRPDCFEYQLDMDDQERPKNLTAELSYKEPNADPTSTYRVRMRMRKTHACQVVSHWSDWSHTVTVEPSVYTLSTVVIVSISLGIPMILLAVLLLLRHQRVSKVLFPPIPRPPPKYKGFLEKSDTFNLFHSAPLAEPVEEITKVEDMEQKPEKML